VDDSNLVLPAKISIVTPSFNQGHFLEETIESVLSQGYPALEYFVIDGGSTDDSVSVIKRYQRHLAGWVSEADRGQSDALIKGFKRATGTVMNWINSDDVLRPGALAAVGDAWQQSKADLIVGRDIQFTDDVESPVGTFAGAGYEFPDCLRFWDGRFRYHQPPTFFSREIYEAVGGLRVDLHYVMDFDLYSRMLAKSSTEVCYLDAVLTGFRLHVGAKTSRAKAGFLTELRAVSRKAWPASWDVDAEQTAMDRYCAECSIFQAAEHVRARSLGEAFAALSTAVRFSPLHALAFATNRALGGSRAH